MSEQTIHYDARKIAASLTAVAVVLIALSVLVHVLEYVGGYRNRVTSLFDADEEASFATWFSAAILLLGAFVLALISVFKRREGDRFALHWGVLMLIGLTASLSEICMLHERTGEILGARLKMSGIFYHAWVIPAMVVVLAVAVFFLRFLLHLPRATALRFLLAGVLYIGGALGMELIGARHHEAAGSPNNLTYKLLSDVEEFMEMLGVVVALHALLVYVGVHYPVVRLSPGSSPRPDPRVPSAEPGRSPAKEPRTGPENPGLSKDHRP